MSKHKRTNLYIDDIYHIDSILSKKWESDIINYKDELYLIIPSMVRKIIINGNGKNLLLKFLTKRDGYIHIPSDVTDLTTADISIKFNRLNKDIYGDIMNIYIEYLFNNKNDKNSNLYELVNSENGIEYKFTTTNLDLLRDLYYMDLCINKVNCIKIADIYDDITIDEIMDLAEKLSSKNK